jgi:hypothetical protein
MKIERILAGIKGSQSAPKATEKVAEKVASETAAPREALKAALETSLAGETKTAAAVTPGPVDTVMKVAAEMLELEKEAAVKEAQVLGKAFADAVVSRLGEWQKTAAATLAAAPAPAAAPAQVDNTLLKQAAEVGYNTAKAELEKIAEDEYNRGWNETVESIYKTAAEEFLKAAQITAQLIEAGRQAA